MRHLFSFVLIQISLLSAHGRSQYRSPRLRRWSGLSRLKRAVENCAVVVPADARRPSGRFYGAKLPLSASQDPCQLGRREEKLGIMKQLALLVIGVLGCGSPPPAQRPTSTAAGPPRARQRRSSTPRCSP